MERGGVTVNLRHLIKYFSDENIKVSLISNYINKENLKKLKKKIFFF